MNGDRGAWVLVEPWADLKGAIMTVPEYQQLMQPALAAVERAGGETLFDDVLNAVCDHFQLSTVERQVRLASGRETVIASNLRWALSYLTVEGQVSYDGNDGLVRAIRPAASGGEVGFSEPVSLFRREPMSDDDTEKLSELFSHAERQLQQTLLGHIYSREPEFFEQLIVDLLVAMGYGNSRNEVARRLGGSRDGGVDGVVYQDELGLDFIYIQAKRYKPSSTVPIAEVRDFAGSLEAHKAPKGVFVSTCFLPASAAKFVEAVPRRIALVDGRQLASLMIRYNLGVKPDPIFQLKEVDQDYFAV